MVIRAHKVSGDTFEVFYDLINKWVTDPDASSRMPNYKQWIYSAFPDEDISKNKIKYPIIIIDPLDHEWLQFTQTKRWALMELSINVYDTRMADADLLLDSIESMIDSQRLSLRKIQGLAKINLDSTDSDTEFRGRTKVHKRTLRYTMRKSFTSGLGRVTRSTTITSNSEIVAA